jgi:hypothetical protein
MLHYTVKHYNSSTEETGSVSMYLLKSILNCDIIHKTRESTQ